MSKVLEAISPPYSAEFVNLFLPIVENDEITGTMRCCEGDNDPVSEFIGKFTILNDTKNCKFVVMVEFCYFSSLQGNDNVMFSGIFSCIKM